MAFSYTLFLALLLLFPGLCFWAGFRAGERNDFLTPSPDRPGSTTTLFIVVFGTILGHLFGAGFFAVQSQVCSLTGACHQVGYDPNIYRMLLKGGTAASKASDLAIELWLFFIFALGAVVFRFAEWAAQRKVVSDRLDPLAFGWLTPAITAVKSGNAFVTAYVLTKTSHEGASVAYEGTVQQLALDEDQSIKLVILNEADRFLVKITEAGSERVETEASPIAQIHFTSAEIVNIAIEVVQAPPEDVEADEGDPAEPS